MKRVLKLILAIIIALIIIGGVTFLIDSSRVASGKNPICSLKVATLKDGGTTEYLGVGYKIIDFNMLNGYDETKIGSWCMKASDFEKEYKRFDENVTEVENNTPNIQNEEPNEPIVDDEIMPNPDEEMSTDIPPEEMITPEINNEEEITPPVDEPIIIDEPIIENEIVEPTTNANTFRATIIGVNQNNIIVTADEGEEIRNSSDMFSFSNPDLSVTYTVGQRVQIEYTGEILETYPAQITVLSMQLI